VLSWTALGNPDFSPAEQLDDLVNQSAFRFLTWSMAAKLGVSSWRCLRAFTQGLQAQQRYAGDVTEGQALHDAAALFSQAIDFDPNYLAAHYALAGIYNIMGQYEMAETAFTRLQADGQLALVKAYQMGISLMWRFKGDWNRQEAYEHFKKIIDTIDRRTSDPQEQLLLAMAHCGVAMLAALEVDPGKEKRSFEPKSGRMELVKQHTGVEAVLRYIPEKDQVAAIQSRMWVDDAAKSRKNTAEQPGLMVMQGWLQQLIIMP
jgi:tetratricopeptide (TPR) repeat protein